MNEAALKLRDRAEQMGIGVSVHGLVDDHEVDAQRLELGAVQKGLAKADRAGGSCRCSCEGAFVGAVSQGFEAVATVLTRMRKVARDSSLDRTQSLGPPGRGDHKGRGLCRKAFPNLAVAGCSVS